MCHELRHIQYAYPNGNTLFAQYNEYAMHNTVCSSVTNTNGIHNTVCSSVTNTHGIHNIVCSSVTNTHGIHNTAH